MDNSNLELELEILLNNYFRFMIDLDELERRIRPLEEFYFKHIVGDAMDKKMHKITEKMKVAEKDIKKGKKKAAVKTLKKAEKKNERLVKIDRTVRDPMIKKCKTMMKSKPKPKAKAKAKKK